MILYKKKSVPPHCDDRWEVKQVFYMKIIGSWSRAFEAYDEVLRRFETAMKTARATRCK